ncbi:MAG: DUF1549 and DUF1553 domain-containing protein, partial [Planctomycetaceae bacterium]
AEPGTSAIDRFLLAELRSRGLKFNPPASARLWLRRVTLDLIGLPPSAEEVAEFEADSSEFARARVVDRLLAHPGYGMRWGRRWLDVARFAETNGYERDGLKPHAWRYRDWVIDSLNSDLAYDRFVTEQLAGDELPDRTASTLVATTFLRLGTWDDEPADPLVDRYEQLDDIVGTVSNAFLGLTLRCARCHNHKFEPLSQIDYARFLAIFDPLKRPQDGRTDLDVAVGSDAELAAHAAATARQQAASQAVRSQAEELNQALRSRLFAHPSEKLSAAAWEAHRTEAPKRTPEQRKLVEQTAGEWESLLASVATEDERRERSRYASALQALAEAAPRPLPRAYIWQESVSPPEPTRVFRRGNPMTPAGVVSPGFPEVLLRSAPGEVTEASGERRAEDRTTQRRLTLARWLIDHRNPLTPRVAVNRIWQGHFGEGLVNTENDFGVMGSPPSHPGLLDYLASRLIAQQQRLKPLHREIVLSAAYAQSSDWSQAAGMVDGDNRLLWRYPYRRLDAEVIRDSVLWASGRLNWQMGGPGTHPRIHPEVLQGQSRPGSGWGPLVDEQASRRSVYIHIKRSLLVPELELLDLADTTSACEQRGVSTIPTQALTLLNGEFWNSQAAEMAHRIERSLESARQKPGPSAIDSAAPFAPPDSEDEQRVIAGYLAVLARQPTGEELKAGRAFLAAQRQLARGEFPDRSPTEIDRGALSDLCLVLLNLNEFVYLD